MFRILLLHQSDERVWQFQKAAGSFHGEFPEEVVVSEIDAWAADREQEEKQRLLREIKDADFVFLLLHGGLTWFRSFEEMKPLLYEKRQFYFHSEVESEINMVMEMSSLLPEEIRIISGYYELGGIVNFKNLILYLLREFGDVLGEPEPARVFCREGVWRSDEEEEKQIFREADASKLPVIGILVHYQNVLNQDTAHIEALVEAVRESGGLPFPVVSTMQPTEQTEGLLGVIKRCFQKEDGIARIHGLIVTTGFSMTVLADPGRGRREAGESVFFPLGVPVFQAMATRLSRREWEKSFQGMDSMGLGSAVYEPEMDGQIITTVIGCTETRETFSGKESRIVPVLEGVRRTASLAVNWGRLKLLPSEEKRVAVLLHNMPPRRDMLGCAYGLDTPASLFSMIKALREEGLVLEREWKDGQEIFRELAAGVTNESGYLTKEQMSLKSAQTLSGADYKMWYETLPGSMREEMEKTWGAPPGEFLTAEGNLLIPGIRNGNLFVGLQPPRESEERAEELYHSLKHPCPHQYLGYYYWLREKFGATLVVHLGTHGTAEWLPGKAVGISAACYPAVVLADIPHIYPYIMNLPGEGTQAKRRSDAALISHMVPAMKAGGLYGELQELQEKLRQYDNAVNFDQGQTEGLLEEIWELSSGSLGFLEEKDREGLFEKPGDFTDKLHSRLEELRSSLIRDGLHVLGQIPEGERYEELLSFLLIGGGDKEELEGRIRQIPEELLAVKTAFHGGFIKPGASGSPSLGAYEALPTGRNFYGVHPYAIPTRAAYEAGKKLAEELLDRMKEDTGAYPEAVTVVVYSGETMKTFGDTIAEALYLYGVRPRWIGGTDRVGGLERIPLEKLSRPRIDVTLRVSGLFRDNFPNLMELLDEAVNLAASAAEPEEFNFLRKHMLRDIRRYAAQGMTKEQAKKRALARVFSCPPGTYGAGIGLLLSGKSWEDRGELGEAYIDWSGFAYGGGRQGEQDEEAFRNRLSDGEAVVKNLSSVEEDLLDSDDFYNYYGGAIAAAEWVKGEKTRSYTVSSADGRGKSIRDTGEELVRLVRAKALNPAWLQGLVPHGYRGAQEVSALFDIIFGWDAASDLIDDWVYEGLVETYLADESVRDWIEEENPWGLHQMSERLLEAEARGMWRAEKESLALVQEIYLSMEGSLEEMEPPEDVCE